MQKALEDYEKNVGKMTDKELNELREELPDKTYPDQNEYDVTSQHCRRAMKKGFDAAVKALKDNYVEKARVEKLIEALRFFANEINIEPFYSEVKINGTNNTRPQLNMKYFYVARQAIEEYEK